MRPRFMFVGAGFVYRIQLSESRGGGHYLRGGILPATYAARGYLLTGVRECALSLGKRGTFPDGVLAFRTPLHYQAAYPAYSRPPHFRSLLSLSRIKALLVGCLGWGVRPRSSRGRRYIFEISISSFDNTLLKSVKRQWTVLEISWCLVYLFIYFNHF